MAYDVYITRVATGEVRLARQELEWDRYEATDEYWWSEGDMSCDCNRHLEFERAAGHEPEETYPCGDGDFRVRVVLSDGSVPYDD